MPAESIPGYNLNARQQPPPPPSKVQCTTVQRAAQLSATRHITSNQNTILSLDLLLTYTLRPPSPLLFTACAYIS